MTGRFRVLFWYEADAIDDDGKPYVKRSRETFQCDGETLRQLFRAMYRAVKGIPNPLPSPKFNALPPR